MDENPFSVVEVAACPRVGQGCLCARLPRRCRPRDPCQVRRRLR